MSWNRRTGILLHITSLPSPYGIGSFGKQAYKFVDQLKDMGQSLWQILPLSTVDKYGSPYKSYSAFAGNPLLIDLHLLQQEKLLNLSDLKFEENFSDSIVEYEKVSKYKLSKLQQAFKRFDCSNDDYQAFLEQQQHWLNDWVLFEILSRKFDSYSWHEWPIEYRDRDEESLKEIYATNKEEVDYHSFVQYIFFKQWFYLKDYANANGVKIIGDIPIFISLESADLWANPAQFNLDENKLPLTVAGCPPDYFSETGQLWGNPHYRWDKMLENDFDWWKKRFASSFKLYDFVRVDHFRGFAAYWEIPANEDVAINGKWVKAPGYELFYALKSHFGSLPIIVEDLGDIDQAVYDLRDHFNFPGSKVLQYAFSPPDETIHLQKGLGDDLYRKIFGFDDRNIHRIENFSENSVVYTGTHDTNTVKGWFNVELSYTSKRYVLDYLQADEKTLNLKMIDCALKSQARWAIIPLQDLLELDAAARFNFPGKDQGNWNWRLKKNQIKSRTKKQMKMVTYETGRANGW